MFVVLSLNSLESSDVHERHILCVIFIFYMIQLEKVAGENYAEVDWRRSFYLNFIAHTSFTVTVAICRLVM